jgi:hypothetical protein
MNCCLMCGLHDRACVVLSGFSLRGVNRFKSPRHSKMSDGMIVVFKYSNSIFIMFNRAYEDDVDYFVGQRVA